MKRTIGLSVLASFATLILAYPAHAVTSRSHISPSSAAAVRKPVADALFTFTDDPIVAGTTVIKAVHITELRNAINSVRAAAGLAATNFTDASPSGVPVQAIHITEMRTALDQARAALLLPPITYTDSTLTAGVTPVKAVHIQELRNAVRLVVLSCPTITVTNPVTTTFTANAAMSQSFTQIGATGAATFAITSGTLPAGLTLSSSGALTGTPTQTGNFPVVVTATDSNGCSGAGSSYALSIIAGPSIAGFTASASPIVPGTSATLNPTFSGGTGVITNNQDTTTIVATSGAGANVTPTVDTTYTLTVTNAAGASISSSVAVTLSHPQITSFTGPVYWTVGKSGISLTAMFPTANSSGTPTVTFNLGTCAANAPSVSGGTTTQTFSCPGAIGSNTTYTLAVSLGTETTTATVMVAAAPDPSGTAFSPTNSPILPGVQPTFSGTGCTGCTVTFSAPMTINSGTTSGSFTATASSGITASTLFTMSVTNAAGDNSLKTAFVTVTQPQIVSFLGPDSVTTNASGNGQTPVLTAQYTPNTAIASVTGCVAGTPSGSNPTTISFTCPKITSNTQYGLVLSLNGAQTTAAVNVLIAPDPSTTSFSTTTPTINPGSAATLSGSGCSGCTVTFTPPLTIDTGSVTTSFTAHATTPPTVTTAYTMSVTNVAGSNAVKTATVTVTQPQIVSFTGPAYVTTNASFNGQAPVLTAQFNPSSAVATVTGCVGGSTSGTNPTTQTFTCAKTTSNTIYTLNLALGTSTTTATTTVQVASDPSTTAFNTTTGTINPGATAGFSGTGCSGCTISFNPPLTLDTGAFTGLFTAHATSNPTTTTTYTMIATNAAGVSAVNSASVTVTQPQVAAFTGPAAVTSGHTVTLQASFNPSSATATVSGCTPGTPAGSNPTTQTFSCPAITIDTTYTLNVALGTNSDTSAMTVLANPDPSAALTFTASPPVLPFGVTTNQTNLNSVFCGGSTRCTATVTANGATVVSSMTSGHDSTVTQTATTTYTLTVSNHADDAYGTATTQVFVPFYSSTINGSLMSAARQFATATMLASGKLLVTGGSSDGTRANANATAEIFDPSTNVWTSVACGCSGTFTCSGTGYPQATMHDARMQHTATLLQNGTVLITGGANFLNLGLTSVDIYDPSTDCFRSPDIGAQYSLQFARAGHSATSYGTGSKVVVIGGGSVSCEVFTQGTTTTSGTFTACSGSNGGATKKDMQASRTLHTATLLSDGRYIFVTGGAGTDRSADVYDTNSGGANGFTYLSSSIMQAPRTQATATLLSSGKILVAGGVNGSSVAQSSAELVDCSFAPSCSSTTIASAMSLTRSGHAAVKLGNGAVILAGGNTASFGGGTLIDVYNPTSGTFGMLGATLLEDRINLFGAVFPSTSRMIFGGGSTTNASTADQIWP